MFPGARFPLELAARGPEVARGAGAVALRRVVAAGALTGFAFEAAEPAAAAAAAASAEPASAAPLSELVAAGAADALAATAGVFLELLVARDIPHTVLLADGGRSALVLPRACQRADADPAQTGRLVIALAEVVGYAIVYTADDFAAYSPRDYARALADVCLPAAELDALEAAAAEIVRGASR